jgi:hypothetical protein
VQIVFEGEADRPITCRQFSDASLAARPARHFAAAAAIHESASPSAFELSSADTRAPRTATSTSARRCFTAWNAPMG